MTKEQEAKVLEFFNKTIEVKEFALYMRRFTAETIKMYLYHNENEAHIDKDWITDGHFWINELCEILSPYLENRNTT